MAKLPSYHNLFGSDLQTVPDWFRPLLIAFNGFCQSISVALARNLTLQDNFASQYIEMKYQAGTKALIATTLLQPIKLLLVVQVTGDGPVIGGVTAVWQQLGQTVEISQVTGLTAGSNYNLRLLLL